jgi:hypothetical protein
MIITLLSLLLLILSQVLRAQTRVIIELIDDSSGDESVSQSVNHEPSIYTHMYATLTD